jgi:predicted unusual protein kinase regulating ubiquinone biosynthesis (AarF/ABC1/UbiB family)
LAQVHVATLADTGERVAVKIQHPVLDEWAPLDLALTKWSLEILKRVFPQYDLTWLSEEMEVSLPQELDFTREAENADRAREYFAGVKDGPPLIIPRVVWAKKRILVMQYLTGARPDDLEFLDRHGINRDDVSAALARVANEMIFGENAPLHCDPHPGNIAIKYEPTRHWKGWFSRTPNFSIILYDHGLYRDLPTPLRRAYARLWLAVLDSDIECMRKYSKEVAGIEGSDFQIFASAITGRDFSVFEDKRGIQKPRNPDEKKEIGEAVQEGGLLEQVVRMLGKMPRVMLLVLKTNDLSK